MLSGTSFSPYSSKYNLHIRPTYLLSRKNEKNVTIDYRYLTPIDPESNKAIIVSGNNDNKLDALRKLVQFITNQTGGQDILDRILSGCPDGRKRIILVVGSYDQAKTVKDELCFRRQDMLRKQEIFALEREETDSENTWLRQMVSEFGKGNGKILIVPLMALERGYNILQEDNIAAFGCLMYLVRPYPKPYDFSDIACDVNSMAMNEILHGKRTDVHQEASNIVRRSRGIIYRSSFEPVGYKELKNHARVKLLANLWVNCYQIECRLIRGDVDCLVVFADGAFFPQMCEGSEDDATTSVVYGWKDLLWKHYDTDSIEFKLIQELYRPRIEGLSNIKKL